MKDQFGIMVGLKKRNAFEGWFCKVHDPESGYMLSVIWGYSTSDEDAHSFLQITDSLNQDSAYLRYPLDAMTFEEDPFVLHIGPNQFSAQGTVVDVELSGGERMKAELQFGPFSPIKQSFLKPNIMGWLHYFPNECNHSITSMHHTIDGVVTRGSQKHKIREGHGYIEKDWGTSFPSRYVWAQANDLVFPNFVFSYATVPMLGKGATGFFLLIQDGEDEYRFSTIERSRIEVVEITERGFRFRVRKGRLRVELSGEQANPIQLAAPHKGAMKNKIKESLDGKITLMLYEGDTLITSLNSEHGSIDIHHPVV